MSTVSRAQVMMAYARYMKMPDWRGHYLWVPNRFLSLIGCTYPQIQKYKQLSSSSQLKCSQFTYSMVNMLLTANHVHHETLMAAIRAKHNRWPSIKEARTRGRI